MMNPATAIVFSHEYPSTQVGQKPVRGIGIGHLWGPQHRADENPDRLAVAYDRAEGNCDHLLRRCARDVENNVRHILCITAPVSQFRTWSTGTKVEPIRGDFLVWATRIDKNNC